MSLALVIGALGQDGLHLVAHLKSLGYQVIGTTHRPGIASCSGNIDRLEFLNLLDQNSIDSVLKKFNPQEIYNLGGVSSSANLFSAPLLTADTNGMGVLRLLTSALQHTKNAKIFLALSSEVFAATLTSPQDERSTPMPINPYGISKTFAWSMATTLRKQWGLNISTGILYNHESPLRTSHYLSRKLSIAASKASLGQNVLIQLGSPHARRDWGYARDFVNAMHKITHGGFGDDFIIATGKMHSVEEFCKEAFSFVNLDYANFVEFGTSDNRVYRDESVDLCGNIAKIQAMTGWKPETSFKEMIATMVDFDIYLQKNPWASEIPPWLQ